MENLTIIQNKFNDNTISSVNARDLHKELGVKTLFKDWIVRIIDEFNMEEGIDYIFIGTTDTVSTNEVLLKNELNPNAINNPNDVTNNSININSTNKNLGGRPSKEYLLSIETAKVVAMFNKNEIGDKVRKYFIDFENVAKQKFIGKINELESKLVEKDLLVSQVTSQKLLTDTEHKKQQDYIGTLERFSLAAMNPNEFKRMISLKINLDTLVDNTLYGPNVTEAYSKIVAFYKKHVKHFPEKNLKHNDCPSFTYSTDSEDPFYGTICKRQKRLYLFAKVWEEQLGGTDEMIEYMVKRNQVELTRCRNPYTLVRICETIHEALAVKYV